MKPKVGDIMLHRRCLDGSNMQPLRCKITRIAQGVLYYRPHYGLHDDGTEWLGSATYCLLADIDRYLEELS